MASKYHLNPPTKGPSATLMMGSPTQLTLLLVVICFQSGLSNHQHHHHHHPHPAGDGTDLKRTHENANFTEEFELLQDSTVDHHAFDDLKRRFGTNEPVLRSAGRGLMKSTLGNAISLPAKIGKTVVSPPLKAVKSTMQGVSALRKVGITGGIMGGIVDWFTDKLKTIDFPGKQILVTILPVGRVLSVVDTLTKEIMYITDAGEQVMNQALAYAMYASLRLVFAGVTRVIDTAGLDCVKLKPQTIELNNAIVDTISTTKAKACGFSHLKPVNNVTITRNDDKFLIINTPWVLNGISVDLGSIKVTGLGRTILENEPVTATVDKVLVTGSVAFEAGPLLKFVQIHLEVDKMIGLHVTFMNPKKTSLMQTVEEMAEATTGLVTKHVNDVLKQIEDKVYDYIAKI